MFKKTQIAAALLGLTLTAAPALADEATQIKVAYKDLDLTTSEGQRTLDRRLDAAAREACGYSEGVTGTRLRSSQATTCYKQARAKAKDVMASAVDKASDNRLGG